MCLKVQPNFIINILQFRITDHPLYIKSTNIQSPVFAITFAAFIFCLTAPSWYNGHRVKELISYNALLSLADGVKLFVILYSSLPVRSKIQPERRDYSRPSHQLKS